MQMLAAAQQGADAAEKGTRAMSNVLPKDQEQADMLSAMQEQFGGGR